VVVELHANIPCTRASIRDPEPTEDLLLLLQLLGQWEKYIKWIFLARL
jgi:hypothetical protein